MDQPELQAIKASQNGDLTKFTVLYELYVEKIYRFVYFKTFHRETAEDITSLVFMKALEHIGDYQVAKGSFSSWLYRIAHNTVVDHYRNNRPTVHLDNVFDLASKQNLADDAHVSLALDKIKTYLREFDQEIQDLLMMRLWQGLTYQEIADITGRNEGALKMAVSRALKQLKNKLAAASLVLVLMNLS